MWALLFTSFLMISQAPDPATKSAEFNRQELQKIVEQAMSFWRVPGVAIAIVKGDKTLFEGGFGVVKVGEKDPVTAQTIFPLASCSKSFTSALAASLVGKGKLGWEDPVQKHLPWFALSDDLAGRDCRLRDLFSHRTGVGPNDLLWYRSSDPVEDLVKRAKYLSLAKPFRGAFQYQSTMYGAGGLVCEAAGKESWQHAVKKQLFDPLEMKNTFAMPPREGLATGHGINSLGLPRPVDSYAFANPDPAGSIHSGVADLGKWLKFQMDPSNKKYANLGVGEELLETQKPVVVNPLDGQNQKLHPFTVQMTYGMGWVIQDYRGMKLVSHGGAIDGFRIHLAMVPQEKLGIAILANLEQTRMNLALSNILIDEYFGGTKFDWNQHLGKVMSEAGIEGKVSWDKKMVDLLKKHPGRLNLDSVVGDYHHPAYGKATISREGKKVRFTLGALKVDLDSLGGGILFANDFVFDNPVFLVEKDDKGAVKAIQCTGRLEARFERKD